MILALLGPTASGKTDVGLEIAERHGAEIIGADSRQVYRRLDIGSAKPTAAERARVPHHLIDVVEPDETFDCARFRQLARAAIADIENRGRRVLVVGGTGLYVEVLRRGLFDGPPRDEALRQRLREAENAEPGSLHRRLGEVDARAAARLHERDQVRLVRALEVFELTGRPISDWQEEHRRAANDLDVHVIALDVARDVLHARIEARCHRMIEQGLVDEVTALHADFSPELPSLRSTGYAEVGDYVRGLCSLDEAVARMAQATRRLAKRQLTWIRGHSPDESLAPAAVGGAVARRWAR